MGLQVVLEDERGTRIDSVEDPTNVLHRLLPSPDDTSSRSLRYVDWYGDTVFNQRQIGDVLEELHAVLRKAQGAEEQNLVTRIIDLARRCQSATHHYVKFYGD